MYAFLAVETDLAWPDTEKTVQFKNHTIRIRPATESRRADIAVEYLPGDSIEDAVNIGNAFLSQLSWRAKMPIRVDEYFAASFPAAGIGTTHSQHVSRDFRFDFDPKLKSKKQRLALALYREAKGVTSVPFSALGYYKIIKLLFPNDKKAEKQMEWINKSIDEAIDYNGKSRLQELRDSGEDIGRYLYGDVRCAIAHSNQNSTVNPDFPVDISRLHNDLPLLESLARYAIEKELRVKSTDTHYEKHTYEINGFRPLLDSRRLKKLHKSTSATTNIPDYSVSIKMRGKEQTTVFSNLVVRELHSPKEGLFVFIFTCPNNLVHGQFVVDMSSARLIFNPLQETLIRDDGSSQVLELAIERHRVVIDWFCNGETEIFDKNGKLLGTSAPFVGTNIDLGGTIRSLRSDIEGFEAEHRRRTDNERGTS